MGVWGVWSAPSATFTLSRKLSCSMSNLHPLKIQMISMNKEFNHRWQNQVKSANICQANALKSRLHRSWRNFLVSWDHQSLMKQGVCLSAFQRRVREAIRSGDSLSILAFGLTEDKLSLQSAPSLRPSRKQLGTPKENVKGSSAQRKGIKVEWLKWKDEGEGEQK